MTKQRPEMTAPVGKARSALDALVLSARRHVAGVAEHAGTDAGIDGALLGEFLSDALATVSSARRLSSTSLNTYRLVAADAAERGVSLASLIDLYLSATWRLWEAMGESRGSASVASVSDAAGYLFRAADDAAAALADGYSTAQRQTVRREESLRREFVDDILIGTGDSTALQDRAARFGFNIAGTHQVAVASTQRILMDAGPVQARVEARVLASFSGRDVIVATKDGHLVCVFPDPRIDPVVDLLRHLEECSEGPWRLGVGRSYPGRSGIVRSYEEARMSITLADRLGLTNPIARFASMLPYRLLTLDPSTLAETVTAILGPLQHARGGGDQFIETLEAFFEASSNISGAARRLHLSPRAVVYRLDRIKQLTGYAPLEAEGRFVLELAVRGRALLGPDPLVDPTNSV